MMHTHHHHHSHHHHDEHTATPTEAKPEENVSVHPQEQSPPDELVETVEGEIIPPGEIDPAGAADQTTDDIGGMLETVQKELEALEQASNQMAELKKIMPGVQTRVQRQLLKKKYRKELKKTGLTLEKFLIQKMKEDLARDMAKHKHGSPLDWDGTISINKS